MILLIYIFYIYTHSIIIDNIFYIILIECLNFSQSYEKSLNNKEFCFKN